MIKKITFCILFLAIGTVCAQSGPIKIKDEKKTNRLSVYAFNESETDYDVKITIKGKNLRQSSAKPRFIRVPSATKVLLKSLIISRGKQPSYTYDLVINDSLSKRALKPQPSAIKIKPKKQVVLYLTDKCQTCDSIIYRLNNSKYIYKSIDLSEKPNIREQIDKFLKHTTTPLDSVSNPVVSLGGVLITNIDSYEALLKALHKED